MAVYSKDDAALFRIALSSVFRNTIAPNQVVLVCDGPLTKALDEVIDEFKRFTSFEVFRLTKNMGLHSALNFGLEKCKNELIFRADADDENMYDRFETQLNAFCPKTSLLGGQIIEKDTVKDVMLKSRLVPLQNEKIVKRLRFRNPVNHMTVLFRKSAVLSVGGYPSLAKKEDYALWGIMISEGHVLRNVEQTLVKVSVNDTFYARRGGLQYIKSEFTIQRLFIKIGVTNLLTATFVFFVRSAVHILPSKIKKHFYDKILRHR